MKRLALLATGGALWLLLAVTPVFADGGPHQLAINNGTGGGGLAGDCAACHRAHTAQAADLLKEELPALCLSCHNGTGATADVVDGIQYTPNGAGNPTTTVLGALRGGGFDFALIGTPARLNYQGRGSISLTFTAAPASGTSVTLRWAPLGSFAGGDLTFDPSASAATVQSAATPLFGTSPTYSGSGASNMTGLPAGDANVIVAKTGTTFTFTIHNELRLVGTSATQRDIPAPTVVADTTGQNATVVDGRFISSAGKVGVLDASAKQPTTSNHMAGNGVVWGNGAQGIGTAGATGVVLDCAKCHNPHGNGQYRILQTEPGEDWSTILAGSSTLGADITANATTMTVASAATFPKQGMFAITIGSEHLMVTAGAGTTTWTVRRAIDGTTAAAHLAGASVTFTTGWSAPTVAVAITDAAPTTLAAGEVRNYTVRPSTTGLTTGVVGTATDGDYWRYKYDTSGTTNFTNFYLKSDPMQSGWGGDPASLATITPANGAMTAWCIQCHTRYNGYLVNADGSPHYNPNTFPNNPPSLVAQTPTDAVFMFKHGTARIGCEQCHVSHGSNRVMVAGTASADVAWPGAGFAPTTGNNDSRLLKVNNRGTCQLCHDPTETTYASLTVGTVPGSITPGP